MTPIRPREPVLFAENFDTLVEWYAEHLGFQIARQDDAFHYANLVTETGLRLGIALASEMGVELGDRSRNSCVLQLEVDDVRAFLARIEEAGGRVTGGPSYDKSSDFWFGSMADPEGNSWWVVDPNCPQPG